FQRKYCIFVKVNYLQFMGTRFFLLALFCVMSIVGYSQNNDVLIRKEDNPELKVTIDAYFGISLMTTYSGFIRYGFIQVKSTGETQITYLTQSQFMQMVTGQEKSKANPEKIN